MFLNILTIVSVIFSGGYKTATQDTIQLKIKWSTVDSLSDSVKVEAGYNVNPTYTTTHYLKPTQLSDSINIVAKGASNDGWLCVSQHRHGVWGEGACKAWSYTFPFLTVSRLEVKQDSSNVSIGGRVQLCAFLVFNDSSRMLTKSQSGIQECIIQYFKYPLSLRTTSARKRAIADTTQIQWNGVSPPVVSVNGCPDSLPGAIVVRFANASNVGIVRDSITKPVVICGPKSLAYDLMAHPEGGPLTGLTGNIGILSPPNNSKWVAESVPPLIQGIDANHWYLPKSSPYLTTTGLYQLTIIAIKSSKIKTDSAQFVGFQIPIVETNDTVSNGALPVWSVMMTNSVGKLVPRYFYRPARGTLLRSQLTSNERNVCEPNNIILYCTPGVTVTMNGDYEAVNEWWKGWLSNIIPSTQTILDLTVIQTFDVGTLLPSLIAP